MDANLKPNSIFLVTILTKIELMRSMLILGSWYMVTWKGCAVMVESKGIVNCVGLVTVTLHVPTMPLTTLRLVLTTYTESPLTRPCGIVLVI